MYAKEVEIVNLAALVMQDALKLQVEASRTK